MSRITITVSGEPKSGASTLAAHIAAMMRRESPRTSVSVIDEDRRQELLESRSIYALGIDAIEVIVERKCS